MMKSIILLLTLGLISGVSAADTPQSEVKFTKAKTPTLASDGKKIYYPQKRVVYPITVKVIQHSMPPIVYPIGVTPPPLFIDGFE